MEPTAALDALDRTALARDVGRLVRVRSITGLERAAAPSSSRWRPSWG